MGTRVLFITPHIWASFQTNGTYQRNFYAGFQKILSSAPKVPFVPFPYKTSWSCDEMSVVKGDAVFKNKTPALMIQLWSRAVFHRCRAWLPMGLSLYKGPSTLTPVIWPCSQDPWQRYGTKGTLGVGALMCSSPKRIALIGAVGLEWPTNMGPCKETDP